VPDIVPLLRERSQTLRDTTLALESGEFSFMEETIPPSTNDLLLLGAKADAATVKTHLTKVHELLATCKLFTPEEVKGIVFPYATEVGRAAVLWPLRVALSGKDKSPDPFTLAGLLGRKRVLERIETAAQLL